MAINLQTFLSSPPIVFSCNVNKGWQFEWFQTAVEILLVNSFISIFLDILILHFASTLLKRRWRSIHVFIISLTLGDLLATFSLLLITEIAWTNEILQKLPVFCFLAYCGSSIGAMSSILSLVLLNSDKLIVLGNPLQRYPCISKRHALTQNFENTFNLFMVIFFIATLGLSMFFGLVLFLVIRRQIRERPIDSQSSGCSVRRKTNLFLFVFGTNFWYLSTLLPYQLSCLLWPITANFLLKSNGVSQTTLCEIERSLIWLLRFLFLLNPLMNPFITLFCYAPYHKKWIDSVGRIEWKLRRFLYKDYRRLSTPSITTGHHVHSQAHSTEQQWENVNPESIDPNSHSFINPLYDH
ncbi:G-PROTEIN-RECEP-F1-2 domain-containing protein [Aphelenchoides besseyi]|nr:G-PROTEIN-RECEP-F1-2 domain-containing protein [Aphelenchoides besseyi]KAI6210977.1 G-PROTEIN-RECEP-F1-2 domain-containing protein [Aphelenchoides besseyi]